MTIYVCTAVFIFFDIITGLIKGWYGRKLDSTVLRQGLFNKLTEVLCVAFSSFIEYGGDKINLGFELPVVEVVCGYICLTEFISIVENLCEINPSLNKLFGKYLQKAKDKEDEK